MPTLDVSELNVVIAVLGMCSPMKERDLVLIPQARSSLHMALFQ